MIHTSDEHNWSIRFILLPTLQSIVCLEYHLVCVLLIARNRYRSLQISEGHQCGSNSIKNLEHTRRLVAHDQIQQTIDVNRPKFSPIHCQPRRIDYSTLAEVPN
jgi:hypothetical protein